MRIGICLNMLAARPGGTGIEWIEQAAAVGFDYAELPLAEIAALSEEEFTALLDRVSRSGIRCEAMNNFFPRTLRLTGPEADVPAIEVYIRRSLARAARLGAEIAVFGSGPAKSAPEGFPLDKAYAQVADVTRTAAAVAAEAGIDIAIEPLRSAESNLINTYLEGCALARDAGCPNVYALVDYYHMSEMNEPAGHVAGEGALLRHAHFARPRGRAYPASPEEDAGYRPFAAALREAGYKGRISLEAYTADFGAEAPTALEVMRALFSHGTDTK